LKYLKEKPRIEAELIEPRHYYSEDSGSKANYWLGFTLDTWVRNKGDRATTIGDATLKFKVGEKKYRITSDDLRIRVDSNDMVKITPSLTSKYSYDMMEKQEKIPFKLILFHTHGEIKLEGISIQI